MQKTPWVGLANPGGFLFGRLPAVAAIPVAACTALTAAAFTTGTTAAGSVGAAGPFPGGGGVDADHASHPLDLLEVVDGFLFRCGVGQFDKGKAPFPARFPVQGKAALGDLSVGAEEIQ